MDSNQSPDRVAVLIDADNASHRQLQVVLGEVAKYGNPTIKRVYGDWTNDRLSNWAPKLNSLGLRAVHQNAFTKGKNSTDMALVIDAMDLLYDGNVEAFALVTSDSDFTALTHRLRESGKAVYVLGTQKAPTSLRNACDKFIDLDVLADDDADDESAGTEDAHDAVVPSINLQSALTRALNAVSDDDGWASLPTLGNQLVRTHPSFDPRTFAGPGGRLSTLVADQAYLETSGSGNALRVRLKGAPAARRAAEKGAEKGAEKATEKGTDKVADQGAEKGAEKLADRVVEKAVDEVVEQDRATKASTRKAPARKTTPTKAASTPADGAEAPARKRAPRKTAAKKAATKAATTAAAEQPAPTVEQQPAATPVVRVTSRTRSGRPVTRTPGAPTA